MVAWRSPNLLSATIVIMDVNYQLSTQRYDFLDSWRIGLQIFSQHRVHHEMKQGKPM